MGRNILRKGKLHHRRQFVNIMDLLKTEKRFKNAKCHAKISSKDPFMTDQKKYNFNDWNFGALFHFLESTKLMYIVDDGIDYLPTLGWTISSLFHPPVSSPFGDISSWTEAAGSVSEIDDGTPQPEQAHNPCTYTTVHIYVLLLLLF